MSRHSLGPGVANRMKPRTRSIVGDNTFCDGRDRSSSGPWKIAAISSKCLLAAAGYLGFPVNLPDRAG